MTAVAALYNGLPSVDEADKMFVNRDHIFSRLAPLLAAYENKFGLCLVHRHCALEEGEIMVATGNVTQPERDVECFPERWLATGEPYEFNRTPMPSPPQQLFEEFQKIVQAIDILGLFYIQDEQRLGNVAVERTEGRKNIVEIHPKGDSVNSISTGWLLGPGENPTLIACCQCRVVNGVHIQGCVNSEEGK